MSVLVRALPSKDPKLLHVYVKGAPETIKRLCIPETSELTCYCLDSPCTCMYRNFYVCRPFTYSLMCVCRPFTNLCFNAVPADFLEVLTTLTQQGYRVLAIGHKTMHLPWHRAERVQRYIHVVCGPLCVYVYVYVCVLYLTLGDGSHSVILFFVVVMLWSVT